MASALGPTALPEQRRVGRRGRKASSPAQQEAWGRMTTSERILCPGSAFYHCGTKRAPPLFFTSCLCRKRVWESGGDVSVGGKKPVAGSLHNKWQSWLVTKLEKTD